MEINFISGGLAGNLLAVLHFCLAFEYWEQAVVAGFPLKTPISFKDLVFFSGFYTFETCFPPESFHSSIFK